MKTPRMFELTQQEHRNLVSLISCGEVPSLRLKPSYYAGQWRTFISGVPKDIDACSLGQLFNLPTVCMTIFNTPFVHGKFKLVYYSEGVYAIYEYVSIPTFAEI